jgi:hypothetical protein
VRAGERGGDGLGEEVDGIGEEAGGGGRPGREHAELSAVRGVRFLRALVRGLEALVVADEVAHE